MNVCVYHCKSHTPRMAHVKYCDNFLESTTTQSVIGPDDLVILVINVGR